MILKKGPRVRARARVSITATLVGQHCYDTDSVKQININDGQVNDEES